MNLSTTIKNLVVSITLIGSLSMYSQTEKALPSQQHPQQNATVSDAKLSKFANAYQRVNVINQTIQQKMIKKVEASGIEVQRFNEINKAKQSTDNTTEISKEEESKYNQAIANINEIQKEFQQKVEKAISEEGIQAFEYEKIATAIQANPKLQKKLQQLLQS